MNADDIFSRTTRNRLEIADMLDGLSAAQWQEETLCEGWTVRHMAAHLVQPMLIGFGRFFITAWRYRGNTAATVDHLTRSIARREPSDLVAALRNHAPDRVDPPRVGPMGPFAETCVHLRDIARPLSLDMDARRDDWLDVLAYLTSPQVAPALVPRGRASGIALRATDADWRWGQGPEAAGTLEALALAVTGRVAAVDDLDGPGRPTLRSRMVEGTGA